MTRQVQRNGKRRPVRRATKRTRTPASPAGQNGSPGDPLAHTDVYRLLPAKVRAALDSALLAREAGPAAREQIAAKLGLDRYGVTAGHLAVYVAALEQVARPVVTSQVLAAVLGCLPRGYRRRLVIGSEVLLLSRVLAALSDEQSLSVAELGRLAAVIGSLGGARRGSAAAGGKRSPGRRGESGMSHEQLARSVRLLYGLELKREPGGSRQETQAARIPDAEDRIQ